MKKIKKTGGGETDDDYDENVSGQIIQMTSCRRQILEKLGQTAVSGITGGMDSDSTHIQDVTEENSTAMVQLDNDTSAAELRRLYDVKCV